MTWFVQIAMGLHFMHSNRVLHRDIKTQNIFILSSGRVVLGDLGISKVMGGTADFASTQVCYAVLHNIAGISW
jgi:serine/threonine protein kinase